MERIGYTREIMSKTTVSTEKVQEIAKLAKIDLPTSHLSKYAKEFNDILEYVSMLDEVDTSNIPEEHNLEHYKSEVLREDIVEKSTIPQSKMLANATKGRVKNFYIRTKSVRDE